MFWNKVGAKSRMPDPAQVLPGRQQKMAVPRMHHVNGHPLEPPYPEGMEVAMFGLGCFWGAERVFWMTEGVYTTAVGYAGGSTPNATYEEVCSGMTGHNEVVRVVFDPKVVGYGDLLKLFWESHDPSQGMRQGNDVGTQYRSGIYTYGPDQKKAAEASRDRYQEKLTVAGYGRITTEIVDVPEFYYAEDYHQQYLAKNRGGTAGSAASGSPARRFRPGSGFLLAWLILLRISGDRQLEVWGGAAAGGGFLLDEPLAPVLSSLTPDYSFRSFWIMLSIFA